MSLPVIERARRYIAKCPPAISGEGGHGATYHVAALLLQGFALSEGDALMLLHEWNQSCQPPWSEQELRHKIESASRATHTQSRGYLVGSCVGPDTRRNYRNGAPARPAKVDPVKTAERFLNGFRCSEMNLANASAVPMDGDWRDRKSVV